MPRERIVFYDSNDWMYGYNLDKIETLIIPNITEIDINDAIEYFEIKKYFDDGVESKHWSSDDFNNYKTKSEELFSLTMQYFNSINESDILSEYSNVEIFYRKQFWQLFDKCNLQDKISSCSFSRLITKCECSPFQYMAYSKIVKKYDLQIRDVILNSNYGLRVIIHLYEQAFSKAAKLYRPKSLTGDDIKSVVENYLDSDLCGYYDLESIMQMQESNDFPITDELRLLAKRKHDSQKEKIFETGSTFRQGIHLSIVPNQEEPIKFEFNGLNADYRYSKEHLDDTLDNPSILNNFIYLFEYTDIQMRCSLVSKKTLFSVLEWAMLKKTERDYPTSMSFKMLNSTADLQMNAYYNYLIECGIRFENVLLWFFNEYLVDEFKCPQIKTIFPSENSSYYEKCCTIATTFDNVVKQFSKCVENGDIDYELISMSTKPMLFENIPSLVEDKYVYGIGKEFESLVNLLFSDQCMLSFVERIYDKNKEHNCFYDLLCNETVYLSDYMEYDYPSIEFLKSHQVIKITENDEIVFDNKLKVKILRDLYYNEVLSKHCYSQKAQRFMEEMIHKGLLVTKSSLLTVPEINYFNYILNRKEYRNGLEIRNRYLHGNQQINDNEQIHMQNYYTLLRMFVIHVIKINDDFCMVDKVRNIEKSNEKNNCVK